jgi:hypothetical protein
MRGICNRRERITGYKNGPQKGTIDFKIELIPVPPPTTGYKNGPQKGTIDFKIELIPVPPPTPEKFQRKARFRRLKQQLRRCEISTREYLDSLARVRRDYKAR